MMRRVFSEAVDARIETLWAERCGACIAGYCDACAVWFAGAWWCCCDTIDREVQALAERLERVLGVKADV